MLPPSIATIGLVGFLMVGALHMDYFFDLDLSYLPPSLVVVRNPGVLWNSQTLKGFQLEKNHEKVQSCDATRWDHSPPDPLSQWPSPSGNVAAPKGSSPELHWKIACPPIVYSRRGMGAVPLLHISRAHARPDNNSIEGCCMLCPANMWPYLDCVSYTL